MRADEHLDRIRPIVDRVVRGFGFDLYDLRLRRESIGLVLRVVIDQPPARDASGAVLVDPIERSIGIEDCQRVSQDVSAVLDVESPLDVAHTLEVSSPGVDRPLRHEEDFRRFAGRLAKIVVREPVDGQMHFEGRLRGVENDAVVLEGAKGRQKRLPLALITRAKLDVEF